MLHKVMVDVVNEDLGVAGGVAYSPPLALAGMTSILGLYAFLHAEMVAGAAPTLDVIFQVSWDDGAHWVDSLDFTQVDVSLDSNEALMWLGHPIAPLVRVQYTIGGGATPTYSFYVVVSAFGTAGYWG